MKKTSPGYKWVMMAIICIGIIVPQYAQFMLTRWGSVWLEGHGYDSELLPSLITAPLIPGVCMSLVAGLLVDRFGLKKLLILSLSLTTAATIFRIWAGSYAAMFVCMMMAGVMATFFNANQMKLIGRWFPPRQIRIGMGIFIAMANCSMAIGSGIGTLFPDYNSAFISSAVYSGAALLIWLILGRERPSIPANGEAAEEKSPPMLSCLKVVAGSKKVWIVAAAMMLFQSSALSVSMFMQEALTQNGTSAGIATTLPIVFTVSAAAGCLIMPGLFEKIRRPKLAFAAIGIAAAAGLAFAWRLESVPAAYVCLSLLGFITLGLTPVLTALPLKFPEIGHTYAGTAGGFLATVMLFGNVVLPTYVLMPIAGGDYTVFYLLEGAVMLAFVCLTPLLPLKEKTIQ